MRSSSWPTCVAAEVPRGSREPLWRLLQAGTTRQPSGWRQLCRMQLPAAPDFTVTIWPGPCRKQHQAVIAVTLFLVVGFPSPRGQEGLAGPSTPRRLGLLGGGSRSHAQLCSIPGLFPPAGPAQAQPGQPESRRTICWETRGQDPLNWLQAEASTSLDSGRKGPLRPDGKEGSACPPGLLASCESTVCVASGGQSPGAQVLIACDNVTFCDRREVAGMIE